jgi:hypothetical protein
MPVLTNLGSDGREKSMTRLITDSIFAEAALIFRRES